MLKLEIKMDEKKIVADRKYQVESIYQALEQAFARYRLNRMEESDGTLCFIGNGNPKDYGTYEQIRDFLLKRNFSHEQYSGYHSKYKAADLQIFDLIREMKQYQYTSPTKNKVFLKPFSFASLLIIAF